MAVKVGINGLSIGRNILRTALGDKDIDFSTQRITDTKTLAHP